VILLRRLLVFCALLILTGAPLFASGSRATGAAGEEAPRAEGAPEIVIPEVPGYSVSELRGAARRDIRAVRRGEGGPADLADGAYSIETMLRRDGYPDALVTFSMFDTSGGEAAEVRRAQDWNRVDRVEYTIRPGERFLVGRVTLEGVKAFSRDRLLRFFPGQEAEEAVPFRKQEIDTAMGEVGRLYELEGYADVSVGPAELSERIEEDVRYYDIVVPVDQGDFYVITDIAVDAPGLTEERRRTLEEEADLRGEKFYPRRAAEGAITIRNVLGQEGYLAEVDYQIDKRPGEGPGNASGVVVSYEVDSGPPMLVEDIRVVPREQEELRTRWWFLHSFIPVEEGDLLNLEVLNRSEDRLYGLGLFRLVDLEARPLSPPEEGDSSEALEDPVPAELLVRLTEIDSRQVELSAGWGSYELAKGTASFTDRNVFGIGRYWSTSVHGSFKTYGAETSLSDSILLGPNSTISLTGAIDYRDAPAYDITTTEGRLDLSYRLSSPWRLEGGYSFGVDRVSEAVEEEDIPTAREYRTSRISAGAIWDDRNSMILPTDGTEVGTRMGYSTSFIGSDLEYIEASFFGNYHERLFDPLVFTFVWAGTTRLPLRGVGTLPIQERLFLGGANSVRAYPLDELGPVSESGEVVGGLTSVETTAELRLRVIDSLHLAGFYDVGVVSREKLSIDGTFGQAVGVGLRYYLPIGPIRGDLAYNPVETAVTDRRWVFHFAIGFGF
jgi:outer membrane protein insertion porin family